MALRGSKGQSIRTRFDKKYYERFYGGAQERARYKRDEQRLGAFVGSYLNYLGQPVRNVVDLGCGFGQWQGIIAEHFPKARYLGVERSEFLCRKFGWIQSSIVDFDSKESFDLVICKDTLQYLTATEFRHAVKKLAKLCRGALYTSILTSEDWKANCDRKRTDARVHLRTGNWYRKVLASEFTNLGGGVFLSPKSPAIPWELETLPSPASKRPK